MGDKTVGTTSVEVAKANKKRVLITFGNSHATAIAHVSDKPTTNPTDDEAHVILPGNQIIISRKEGFPERAWSAYASASMTLTVGSQYEDERQN